MAKKTVFILLLSFLGFCGGTMLGSFFVPDASGMAGPAIAFMYGLAGLAVGVATGIILGRFLKPSRLRKGLIIAGAASLVTMAWIIYRISIISNRKTTESPAIVPAIRADASFAKFADNGPVEDLPIGMGIAKPHLSHGHVIYFYHLAPFDAQPYQVRPVDSIVIQKGEHHFEIRYAPPWFFPEHMKLDYDLLAMRTITVSRNWLEVVVNKESGQTTWISREDAEYVEWPSFLLNVFSIELADPESNPIRFKPLDHASIVATTPERFPLKPLAVQGDWMLVPTLGLADRVVPYGWIRWRSNDKLLVTYSLLS